jgi:hypothetical protein
MYLQEGEKTSSREMRLTLIHKNLGTIPDGMTTSNSQEIPTFMNNT